MLAKTAEKILVFDDGSQTLIALKDYLISEGHVVSLLCDGATVLDMLVNEKDYALVIIDINMPNLNGITALKQLQKVGSDAAVIMMSAEGSEELAVECMRNGAADYISKPFALIDIQQKIKRVWEHRLALIQKRQLQQEREDFVLMLSHDMKNPLTAAIGSIDIIREGCLGLVNKEQNDYLQSAIDSCNEVVAMIDNMLDIKKFAAGKVKMSIHTYSALELINKLAVQFATPAKNDGIELSLDLEPTDVTIAVDKSAFNRVFGNLLGNALKFTPEGGRISIASTVVSGELLQSLNIPDYLALPAQLTNSCSVLKVKVTDSGNGMPSDELERIFDRYTQFSRKVDRGRGGAGLGLAYCKLAVESFNGVIWAESEVAAGSEFVILLPCSK